MATATQSPIDPAHWEGRLILHDVGWNDYQAMLDIVGERHIRVTYDRGTMEVAMPSQKHERAAQLILRFIELDSTMDKIRWAGEIRDWVRNELIPRRAKPSENK